MIDFWEHYNSVQLSMVYSNESRASETRESVTPAGPSEQQKET
jgi:hypothetical protein